MHPMLSYGAGHTPTVKNAPSMAVPLNLDRIPLTFQLFKTNGFHSYLGGSVLITTLEGIEILFVGDGCK